MGACRRLRVDHGQAEQIPSVGPQTGFAEIGRANSTPVARHFSQADFWLAS
jgi:hypothetical protein